MLTADTVLQGRYRVIRQLGQGGMGAVYEALDERLDTVVALKETLFTDERLRKQFEREARLLARMHHPALPRVSDHCEEGDGQFLVMQFVAGDDLDQMMRAKQAPFPPDQVLNWGDQLLDALDYLHTQDPQIIHRDIKPQNLKITARGQIILLDFGLAKGQSGGVSVVTTSASIFGYTPNYAPLEQIQGLGTDARSDIYALSATLYHLITAVKPPDALTRAAAIVNGQPDPLVPANAISSSIGPEVASVLARGMSQNREQRFATAAGMRAALSGSGEAVTLAGRSEAATVIRANPLVSSEAATQVNPAPTAAGTGETTVVQTPVAPKKKISPWAIATAAVVLIGAAVGAFYAFQHKGQTPATPAVVIQQTPTPQPSQTIKLISIEPSNSPEPGKKAEATGQRAESTAKRAEAAAKPAARTSTGASQGSNPEIPKPPKVTVEMEDAEDESSPDTPNANRRPRRGFGARSNVHNFPDGSKLITIPDGSQMLIKPDGTRRVFPQPRKFPQ